jgi:hypothetical protein
MKNTDNYKKYMKAKSEEKFKALLESSNIKEGPAKGLFLKSEEEKTINKIIQKSR